MVSGEQLRSQQRIALRFTVYQTHCAMRLALCLREVAQSQVSVPGFFTETALLSRDPRSCCSPVSPSNRARLEL